MSARKGQQSLAKDIFHRIIRRCFAYGFLALMAYITSRYTLESAEAAGDATAVSIITHTTTWFGTLSALLLGIGLVGFVLYLVVLIIVKPWYQRIVWSVERMGWS